MRGGYISIYRVLVNLAAMEDSVLRTILFIIVIIILIGALPTWPYSAGWGYYPSGGAGLLLIIVIVLLLVGVL
jgi:hypothetical protein